MQSKQLLDANVLQDYAQNNRRRLMECLPDNAAVIVSSGAEQIRNRDVEYPFRADSDFYYLSAFIEPESILVLTKNGYRMFLRKKDPEKEIWQGRRVGTEEAPEILRVDQAYAIEKLQEVLPQLLTDCQTIYFSFSQMTFWAQILQGVIDSAKAKSRQGIEPPDHFCDLDRPLHELRLIKQPLEIKWMRQAAQMSVEGHLQAMKAVAEGKTERQIQGALENGFWQAGAQREAFNSIVAGGENACILHYTENSRLLNRGDLVLVDAGAEFACFAGDITTTFPVSGGFSDPQKQIYELVLKAQQTVIEMIRPGVIYHELHQKTLQVLTQGLVELKILQGEVSELISGEAYKPYFMHGTGHWLGMDVHDVGAYKQQGDWRPLQAGMVLTVEPGLYLSEKIPGLDRKWHSIGVRIEDDVLVTDNGCEVLTKGLPRTVNEIEQWMNGNR